MATIETVPVVPLRRSFGWVLTGNTVYALCQWVIISAVAKLGTTALVGQFALALAMTAPVFMLSNLFLRGIQATDARSEFRFADYFTLRTATTVAGLVIVGSMLFLVHRDRVTFAVVMLVGCAKAVESFSDVIAGLLQKRERLDQVATSMMLKGVFSVLGFVVAFAYWRSLVTASAVLCITWLAVLLLYDMQKARRSLRVNEKFLSLDVRKQVVLAKLATPVGVVVALASLGVNIPRYFLEHYRGSSDLGIFAALSYLVVGVGLIVNALGQSSIVRLSQSFADGDTKQYLGLLKRMSLIGGATAVVGVGLAAIWGRPVLRLVYGPVYAAHLGLLILLIAVAGVNAVAAFFGCGMTAARRFKSQVPVTLSALASGTVTAFVLTPKWGMTGAALAILATALVQAAGGMIVVLYAVMDKDGGSRSNVISSIVSNKSLVPLRRSSNG